MLLLLTVVVSYGLLFPVKALGSLEERIMCIMWQGEPMAVREVVAKLKKKLAHTTVMTTLDRLYKKGLLARSRDGLAYVYRPAMSEGEFHSRIVEEMVGGLIEKSTRSVLAAFVETAAELDEENLRTLESLIKERRRRK